MVGGIEKRGRSLEKVGRGLEKRDCHLALLCFLPHICAGCNAQVFVSSCKPGALAPLYAWGPGLRSGSLPAFWARAGWEGEVAGWEGGVGQGGVGWLARWGGAWGKVGAGSGRVGCWRAEWGGAGTYVHIARKSVCMVE